MPDNKHDPVRYKNNLIFVLHHHKSTEKSLTNTSKLTKTFGNVFLNVGSISFPNKIFLIYIRFFLTL